MEKIIKNFYNLEAWQLAHKLTIEVYNLTKYFPKEETYGITSQLRRATSSVSANIAEGFARYHYKDKIRFYHQARGSVAETQNFLLLAKDLRLIDFNTCKVLGLKSNDVARLINGLIRSLDKQI